MHGAHLVDEDEGAERLLGRDLLAEDGLDLVLAAAERDDEIGMIVNVEIVGLAGLEPDLPDPDELVLEQDLLADFAKRDAAIGRGLSVRYWSSMAGSWLRSYFAGRTAMALISIR